jgi:hypothetical protein
MFAVEAQELLAALEEIGGDGDIDLTALGLGFEDELPADDIPPEAMEAS